MKKINLSILVVLLAWGLTPQLWGQDGPKINKDLIQEGIEMPNHPNQDLTIYPAEQPPNTQDIDLRNKLILDQMINLKLDEMQDPPPFKVEYSGVFFTGQQALGNIRLDKALPSAGIVSVIEKISKVEVFRAKTRPCLEDILVLLPALGKQYDVV